MTATEHVEKLKADRRAELAAAKLAEEARERETTARKQAAWAQGVIDALAELGEDWLAPFRAPDKDRDPFDANGNRTYREAAFVLPGHRTLFMRVEDISYHDAFKWRAWPLCNNNWLMTWACKTTVSGIETHPTLADTLIAAEIKPGETTEEIPF